MDQNLASPAPKGVTLSPSSGGRRLWDQDLRPLELSAWHVLWVDCDTANLGRAASERYE